MVIYSHSRLSTFEQCKLRFKYRYIDKIKPEIDKSIEAHLGTCVHDSFEWLYIEVGKGNLPELDEVIQKYTQKWEEGYSPDIKIVNKSFTAQDYYNKGIQFIVSYYMKHCPFKDGTLETEKRVVIDLDGTGKYTIQGYIDRLVYDKELNRYEVHDYKTARSLPQREKFEKDRQLALYSIGVKDIYGSDKEVVLIWHYLAHNTKIVSKRTQEQLENLKKEIIQLINEIESCESFPANKGILCNWCEYKTMCPVFGGSPGERQKKL